MSTLNELLKVMIARGGSDLHITTGSPPRLRIAGSLLSVEKHAPLTPEDTEELCSSIMTSAHKRKFEENREIDISFGIKGLSRFRANIFMQRGAPAGTFRAIPFTIRTLEELGLPSAIGELTDKTHGLILVTGPTCSGKSSTLAAMIDRINSNREVHIVTVEDPMEFVHNHKRSLINQREIDSDTASFSTALRHILRQDPDVVMIGNMHDQSTVKSALAVAETRHLTLAALNTGSAIQTLRKIIEFFPPHKGEQVRAQLATVLEGVISQRLIPKASEPGNALAVELLIPTPAVRNLLREDKLQQVYSMMQAGDATSGLLSMNRSIFELYSKGIITAESAGGYSPLPEEMLQMLAKSSGEKGRGGWAGGGQCR